MSRYLIALLTVPYAFAHGIAQPTDGSCPAGSYVSARGATSAQAPAEDLLALLQVDVQTQSGRGARDSTRPVRSATPGYPCGMRQQGEAMHKPLIYLHIHKAGGTIMCDLAEDNGEVSPGKTFTSNGCCQNNTQDGYMFWIRDWSGAPYTCADRCMDVKTHGITYEGIERELRDEDFCPDMFEYATVVRDPISLMESTLNYEAVQPLSTLEPWIHDVNASSIKEKLIACLLYDHAESCQEKYLPTNLQTRFIHFDNYMVRVLGGPAVMTLPPKAVNATHLQKALDLLAKFNVVLRFEDLWEANNTDPLRQAFGWNEFGRLQSSPEPVWGVPVTTEHGYKFSEQERAAFRDLNKYDYELYNSVMPSSRSAASPTSIERQHA